MRGQPAVEDWQPQGARLALVALASLPVLVLGLLLFLLPLALRTGQAGSVSVRVEVTSSNVNWAFAALIAVVVLLLLLVVVHEAIHAVLFRQLGGSPRFGVGLYGGLLPGVYVTAPGTLFSRGQFLLIALAPTVVISVVGFLLVLLAPFGGYLVVPLAAHLACCLGDWDLAVATLQRPRGTLVEDTAVGARFYRPGVAAPLPGPLSR